MLAILDHTYFNIYQLIKSNETSYLSGYQCYMFVDEKHLLVLYSEGTRAAPCSVCHTLRLHPN